MIDPWMLHQALSITLEGVINKAMAHNIDGTQVLDKLAQQTLNVSINELGCTLSFSVNDHKVLVAVTQDHGQINSQHRGQDVHSGGYCSIETSLQTLRQLNKQPLTQLIKQQQLDISGDINVAQQFVAVAKNLDIDWQSELANHIGDVATYKLSRAGQDLASKLSFAKSQMQQDIGEWLVHEQGLLLTRCQVQAFNQEVKLLANQSDSLLARFERLCKRQKGS